MITILTEKQNIEAKQLKAYYKYIYVCNKCGEVYGSDFLDKTYLCPIHSIKEKKK